MAVSITVSAEDFVQGNVEELRKLNLYKAAIDELQQAVGDIYNQLGFAQAVAGATATEVVVIGGVFYQEDVVVVGTPAPLT